MARFPPERLRGRALVLRRPKPDEFLPVLSIFRDDREVTRFVAWQPRRTEEEAMRFLGVLLDGWERGRPMWWMTRAADDAVVGSITAAADGEEVEISTTVRRESWGHGHATEAVGLVAAAALANPSCLRVLATCDAANTASARVLMKAGFRLDAHLPRHGVHNVSVEPRDCLRYVREAAVDA